MSETSHKTAIIIGPTRSGRNARGWWEISAEVDGTRVFFSSPDIELDRSPESFGCAFLIAALIVQRPLRFEMPVSREWKNAATRVMHLIKRWWGYEPIAVIADEADQGLPASDRKTGIFFSGGVDAFHALLHSGPADALVFVHGFDLRLNEKASRAAELQETETRRIAHERGMQAVLVRTTLRSHPLLPFHRRKETGGSVMMAIAQVLRGRFSTMRIASSCEGDASTLPLGTHPELDPLWDTPAMRVEHFGAEVLRIDKVRLIAGDDEVRRTLRVCWKPTEASLNCCRCEKCLITMLHFKHAGVTEPVGSLIPPEPIADLIDRLGPTPDYMLAYWEDDFVRELSPAVRDSIARFVARTRRHWSLEASWYGRAYLRICKKLGV